MGEKSELKIKDYVFIAFLFVFIFWLFTLPVKDNPLPFGEGDAAHQFGISDYISYSDKITPDMPHHIAIWYWRMNPNDPYATLNPQPAFVNQAIMQTMTGDRFLSVTYYFVFACIFLIALATFWITRKLFGFYQGVIASVFGSLSMTNVMSYLWGQRLILIAISFVILTCYLFYKYFESFNEGKDDKKYLILAGFTMATCGVFHAQSIMMCTFMICIFLGFMLIKYKKLPFNITSILIFCGILFVLFLPFVPDLLGFTSESMKLELTNLGDTFHWFRMDLDYPYYDVFKISALSISLWMIPFMLIGLTYLLIRRKDNDLLIFSLIIGSYIALHLHMVGILSHDRVTRFLKLSPYLFAMIYAIGIIWLTSFIKEKQTKKITKIAVTIVLFIFLYFIAFTNVKTTLEESYQPPLRINQAQVDASTWINENTNYEDNIRLRGEITYPESGFFWLLSHRNVYPMFYGYKNTSEHGNDNRNYVVFDYSYLEQLKGYQQFSGLYEETKEIESRLDKSRLLYDKGNIRIYDTKGVSDEVW